MLPYELMSFAGALMFMDYMEIKIVQKEEETTRNNASRFKLGNRSRGHSYNMCRNCQQAMIYNSTEDVKASPVEPCSTPFSQYNSCIIYLLLSE